MNISLTTELERFVSSKVESGRYNSASEVVREALRLLEEHDQTRASQLAGFDHELSRRLESLTNGEHISPVQAKSRLAQNLHSDGKRKRERLHSQHRCRVRSEVNPEPAPHR